MINIIAAIGKNRELGKDNKLLWHIPEDFKRFKALTSRHVVIMGRKTYESLPEKFRPLPNRVNIVVTRDLNFTILERPSQDGNSRVIVCHSIEEALQQAKSKELQVRSSEVLIIGGASIYAQAIKYADKLYLTLVGKEFPGADAFFPDYSQFKKVVFEEEHRGDKYSYKFIELIK